LGYRSARKKIKKKEFKILFYFGNLSNLLPIDGNFKIIKKKVKTPQNLVTLAKILVIFSQKSFA
jgi:hypothetical protein